jgi:GDPmannose 4,6-dehydratase
MKLLVLVFLHWNLLLIRAEDYQFLPKIALIFGIAGQDGIYLTEFLLEKKYIVYGIQKEGSQTNQSKLRLLNKTAANHETKLVIYERDLRDVNSICLLIKEVMPDEIYNLAAESSVGLSFKHPVSTIEVNALGPLHILETIRELKELKKIKFYQASTSEMFGKVKEIPEVETTPFNPRSPYAVSKLCAYWITVNYREAFGLFACNGILCNHESPLRPENFVTRKIVLGACRYKFGLEEVLYLGNLNVKRDWGYAKDYVETMWLMLQQAVPDDYVIATGKVHSVREFVEIAYKEVGVDIEWCGQGLEEYGIDKKTGKVIVKVDAQFYRPLEVEFILGSGKKAKEILHWEPRIELKDLIKIMIKADIERIIGREI